MTAWRSALDEAELRRIVSVAHRFYIDGATKSELADEFGVSRSTVARMIENARAHGLVRIVINTPPEVDAGLSERLRSAFDLEDAIVVNAADEESTLHRRLGQTAAELLSETVVAGDVLGVALGRTLWAMSSYLTRLEQCICVPLTGVLPGGGLRESSLEILRRVAAVSGGPTRSLYVPWLVSDASTAQLFREQPEVAQVLAQYGELTRAVVAVGSWEPINSTLADSVDPAVRRSLVAQEVQAEVAGVFLDRDGQVVETELNDRLIGVTADQLRAVPHVVAVAGGRSKWKAVRAVLSSGIPRSVVTDAATARFLLNDRLSSSR